MNRSELIEVARGDRPADLLIRDARVVNTLTAEIESVEVAVAGPMVAGVGEGYTGAQTVELEGRYLVPGLIDAHVHIESSLATPFEFARAVVPRGTTTVIADPHEIANVHGLSGILYMLDATEGIPLTVLVMASSCVPATAMGTAGASLGAEELGTLRAHPRILGLAEVMNFPGVIQGDSGILEKIEIFESSVIDGHAPGVSGAGLNAYLVAGPRSDHEATTPREALEKLRRGMFLFFREATNARNLSALLPCLTPSNHRRVALCTDDRQPADLLDEGGVDALVRMSVRHGLDPLMALRLATLNPADHFGLRDRGAIAPGRRADFFVVSSLEELDVDEVWAGGKLVAQGGEALFPSPARTPEPPPPSMAIEWDRVDLGVRARTGSIRVIRAVPDQIVTGREQVPPTVSDGFVVADPSRDLLKIAVIERHSGSGRVGIGFVAGIGLRDGAIAGTVAHDHHNVIVIGADDRSMMTAARAVAATGGGLAAAVGDRVLASLPLPVGGLMSPEPIGRIRAALDDLVEAARTLGSGLHDPFMAMSFLGLEVIPSLKITDQGLIDVEAFQVVDLWT